MLLPRLALRSLRNRAATAILVVLAVALSSAMLLGVDTLRTSARQSFTDTISGTDLIVGARSGDIQLLLYSIFRIGSPTGNISWLSVERLQNHPNVTWTIPLSLGDSHRGYRVVGTTDAFFTHYRYRRDQPLRMIQGQPFDDLFDAVIGAEVARDLGYTLDQRIIIAHGLGATSFSQHEDHPFRIAGILEHTGTPIDRSVHVSLEAIEAIHVDWQSGAPAAQSTPADVLRQMDLSPKAVTAVLVGLESRMAVFRLQRAINNYRAEALSAILPGVALQSLWSLVGTAETALAGVAIMVVVTALIGMVAMILASLHERRREMAILRSVGAGPLTLFILMLLEALLLCVAGAGLGLGLLYAGLGLLQPWIDSQYGIYLPIEAPDWQQYQLLGSIVLAGTLAGILPALAACRLALSEGLSLRH